MNAEEIFEAIFSYGYSEGINSVLPHRQTSRQITEHKLKAVDELRLLVAIRDDTDMPWPEISLRND